MNAKDQIITATVLGTIAFKEGKKAPAQDSKVLEMIAGRKIGETPKGEASTIAILRAWNKAWHSANLSRAYDLLRAEGNSNRFVCNLFVEHGK